MFDSEFFHLNMKNEYFENLSIFIIMSDFKFWHINFDFNTYESGNFDFHF